MGEKTRETLKLQFDKRLRLEFHGARITSDAGLLACRELDEMLGLTEMAPTYLQETRGGRNVQHDLVPLLRQSSKKDEDSMISFMMQSFANVDGRGFQEQRYTDRSWRRLLQGPVVELDNKVPCVYYWLRSNEGQDASLRIEMGNPKLFIFMRVGEWLV